MEFELIDISHRELIQSYLKRDKFMISDVTFGNLFIWRHSRRIRFCILYECLVIETKYEGKDPFCFFPIGSGDKTKCIKKLREYYRDQGLALEFHSLEENSKNFIDQIIPDLQFKHNRDRSDYIYNVSDLIHLRSRKFHKKKNHLNRFFDEFKNFCFVRITQDNAQLVRATYVKWFGNTKDEGLANESMGILDVLDNYDALELCGGFLSLGDEIIAFSFGEKINSKICVIHVEKADVSYRGAYQAINQQLLLHCFSDCEIVNREEDLGLIGLRKAKLSYHPIGLVDKYEVSIN